MRDPFFTTVPAFFGMTLKELFAIKHPTGGRSVRKSRSAVLHVVVGALHTPTLGRDGACTEQATACLVQHGQTLRGARQPRRTYFRISSLMAAQSMARQCCRAWFAQSCLGACTTALAGQQCALGHLFSTLLGHLQVDAYEWIDGMEQLLRDLQLAGVELHAMSNYPVWYKHVNQKLGLDRYACFLCCTLFTSTFSYHGI